VTDGSGFGRLDRLPEDDPNRLALASIDTVHSADPRYLNEPVARLHRFVRLRRPLYYSVLAPFGFLSRASALLVLLSGVAALVGALVAILSGVPWPITALLVYWSVGALSYHALSVRLAALMSDAAASVGLKADQLLAMWRD
jgi:hypothetical protein